MVFAVIALILVAAFSLLDGLLRARIQRHRTGAPGSPYQLRLPRWPLRARHRTIPQPTSRRGDTSNDAQKMPGDEAAVKSRLPWRESVLLHYGRGVVGVVVGACGWPGPHGPYGPICPGDHPPYGPIMPGPIMPGPGVPR